jgi:hypothetical protein
MAYVGGLLGIETASQLGAGIARWWYLKIY